MMMTIAIPKESVGAWAMSPRNGLEGSEISHNGDSVEHLPKRSDVA
jgi:hypothetical protein